MPARCSVTPLGVIANLKETQIAKSGKACLPVLAGIDLGRRR